MTDPSGEAIYLHDLETGQIWTPTALPVRRPGTYIARHGTAIRQREQHGISTDMAFSSCALDAPAKTAGLNCATLARRWPATSRSRLTPNGFWARRGGQVHPSSPAPILRPGRSSQRTSSAQPPSRAASPLRLRHRGRQPDSRPGRVHRGGRLACRACRHPQHLCRARPAPPSTLVRPCSAVPRLSAPGEAVSLTLSSWVRPIARPAPAL